MINTALIRLSQPVSYSSSAQLKINTAFRPRANTALVRIGPGSKKCIGSGLQFYFRSDITFAYYNSTRRNFGRFRTFIIPRPYYDSSHWNYFRKSSMKEVLK
jgi:hypothetical protein